MSRIKDLQTARKAKKDEFYTQLTDIEKELQYYWKQFENKIVYCNCDDPEESNFFRHFALNFDELKLKKIITTHFVYSDVFVEGSTYKLELDHQVHIEKGGKMDLSNMQKVTLKDNGDFRSAECIELLKEADIVCTNPPFSLFREYVAQLVEYDKQFLILGNMNAITYKEIFKLIKENKLRLGYNWVKQFKTPEGTMKPMGNVNWYTNLYVKKYEEDIYLYKDYNAEEYLKYDNYDAINIDKTKEIPRDYDGVMGVPISFLDKWNPNQFEIVGNMSSTTVDEYNKGYPFINGDRKYARILIRRR